MKKNSRNIKYNSWNKESLISGLHTTKEEINELNGMLVETWWTEMQRGKINF